MNNDQLIEGLSKVDPAAGASPDPAAATSRLAEIVGSPREASRRDRVLGGLRRRQDVMRLGFAGVATAGALAVVIWLGGSAGVGPSSNGGHPEFAAAAVRVAEDNPRVLVTVPGWSVSDVGELTRDNGEMYFSNGEHELELTWYPAESYDGYYADRTHVDPTPTAIEVLGKQARTVQYGESEYATMIPPLGDVFVEIRGDLGSYEAYADAVSSLQPTDVDTWLAALPKVAVQPNERSRAVDEMLEGIPLPGRFDVAALKETGDDLANSRTGLAFHVTSAVACAWLDQWTGQSGEDAAARAEARRALDSVPSWPALTEMGSSDGFLLDLTEDGRAGSGYGRDTDPKYWLQLDCLNHIDRQPAHPWPPENVRDVP